MALFIQNLISQIQYFLGSTPEKWDGDWSPESSYWGDATTAYSELWCILLKRPCEWNYGFYLQGEVWTICTKPRKFWNSAFLLRPTVISRCRSVLNFSNQLLVCLMKNYPVISCNKKTICIFCVHAVILFWGAPLVLWLHSTEEIK